MNIALLKSKMALNGDTQTTLAEYLGVTNNTMSNKMIGKYEFKHSEIEAIARRYKLTAEELTTIFFNEVGD